MNTTRTERHVLVVEDDAPSRALLARRLARQGWQVETAADGPQALAWMEANHTDAVLLDIGLPGMSGLDVLARIRARHPRSHLPVIMVTAFDGSEQLGAALQAGANDFVAKPVDFPVLLARLQAQFELVHTHRELEALKSRLELILEGSNDGIWEWSLEAGRIHHSAHWNVVLGETPQARSDPLDAWLQRIHPGDRQHLETTLQRFLESVDTQVLHCEYRILGADGRYRWILTRGAAQRAPDGRCLRCAGTHTDISALRYTHRLTDLPNLARLADELMLQTQRAQARAQEVAAILLRLDDLEHLPDLPDGKRSLLRRLGETLSRELPECALIGSGENIEHLVIIPTVPHTDRPTTETLAQRALAIAANGIETPIGRIAFQATAGIARMESNPAPCPETLLAAARLAAREARAMGCAWLHHDEHLAARAARRRKLVEALPQAIHSAAIQAWLQPIIGAGGRTVGFEMLARWLSGDGEQISPAEFIPLVEKNGLMPQMTEALLAQSLPRLKSLISEGLLPDDGYVAVNIPPAMLDEALPAQLLQYVREQALTPGNLCIEVTESSAITDLASARHCLQRLKEAGFRLALDDFGTGYASLNTLHRLPFDTLKIDQSFVRNLHVETGSPRLIEAIIAIARALGLKLVAEGVETQDQAHWLRSAGVDRLQGYLLARPMPIPALADWLRNENKDSNGS